MLIRAGDAEVTLSIMHLLYYRYYIFLPRHNPWGYRRSGISHEGNFWVTNAAAIQLYAMKQPSHQYPRRDGFPPAERRDFELIQAEVGHATCAR